MAMPANKIQVPNDISPGIYRDIPGEVYHLGPGISSTGIKKILRTASHFKDAMDLKQILNEEGEPEKETPALVFGKQYHQLILEPDKFHASYIAPPPDDVVAGTLRTVDDFKAALKARELKVTGKKEELAARLYEADPKAPRPVEDALADYAGHRTILDPVTWERLTGMERKLRAHPTLSKVFETGDAETSIYWIDPETGVLCKVRPDWTRWTTPTFLADLKSAIDASRDEFERAIFKFGYHISAAMYLEGYEAANGESLDGRFIFAAQEHYRPYEPAPYVIDDDALAIGKQRFHEALRTYAACLERDEWPGYSDHILPVSLPAWALRREQSK